MDGAGFVRIIRQAFSPFLADIGYLMGEPVISGKYYRAGFDRPDSSVWICYEPGESLLDIYVFSVVGGVRSDIDERTSTPRLGDLNAAYMGRVSADSRRANDEFFRAVSADDAEERRLLKCAKELRLVLPIHLSGGTG